MNGNSSCITTDNASPKEFTARYSRTILYICFISYQEERHCRSFASNDPQYWISYSFFMSNIIKIRLFINKLTRLCRIRRVNDITGRSFCFICFNITHFLLYKRLLNWFSKCQSSDVMNGGNFSTDREGLETRKELVEVESKKGGKKCCLKWIDVL